MSLTYKETQEAVRPLLENLRARYRPEYQATITETELLGILVAQFVEWCGSDVAEVAQYAFEDSNYSKETLAMEKLAKKLA